MKNTQIPYKLPPLKTITINQSVISFFEIGDSNIDHVTVASFGEEWDKFAAFTDEEIQQMGNEYFDIIDLSKLRNASVLDVGCGTGRWTRFLAPHVASVDAIDPSKSIYSAVRLLEKFPNVRFSQASVSNLPFADESFDFVFSLGVLHHIPDTQKAMADAVKQVKIGGQFLVYIYYSLDNRGPVYKMIFHTHTLFRRVISKMPQSLKNMTCEIIAFTVYLPFIGLAKLIRYINPKGNIWKKIPLSYYVGKSLNIVRTDALDRFGTPLEHRFSRREIEAMMRNCGLDEIQFSERAPYWHAVGIRRQ